MENTINVAIVEDDPEIRQTLSLIINGTPGYSCLYTYENCELAIDDLPKRYIQVVLMDIELPGMSGIQGIRNLKPNMPGTDFLMLTIKQDDDSIFQSICAGASGYLIKDTPPSELLRFIDEVNNGGAPMSANIARKVIQSFQSNQPSPLSERETGILRLLCDGMNYKAIAQHLYISAHTVKSHIKNIYKKLHVNSRGAAVKKAIKNNLI